MARSSLNDLEAFVTVADARSFSRAAEKLAISPSALSHAMRGLEARLGVRVLMRTTRSVATTEAGDRLLKILRPALSDITQGLAQARDSRDQPAGTVRLTAVKHAIRTVLSPMLPGFMKRYPDIRIEIDADDGFSDIVADGYDAGIRFSGSVEKDMIALTIGPAMPVAIVASPAYLATHKTPQTPEGLAQHRCILHRRSDVEGTYSWPFHKGGRSYQLRLAGSLAINDVDLVLDAAIAGLGVACLFADQAAPHIAAGKLSRLLLPYAAKVPGYQIYYPSGRHNPPALAALVASLKTRIV